MEYKIRVCEPSISELEKRYVMEALSNNFISSVAPPVAKFKEEFAKKIGVKHAVAVNSGGSALFLTLWALGIREGDEVIVPTFTMVATANAVKQCGATPVFVDSEYDTGNINPDLIEEKITPRTRAIMPVHIYGHPCDMDKINLIARDYGLHVIEDAAESHGALYKGKMTGSLAHAGCFSFYANKIITTGEGGMITTNSDDLAYKLKKLKGYHFDDFAHFWHKHLAWNMRMSSLEAALGLAQLERLDELVEKRRKNAAYYTKKLKGLVETPVEKSYAKSVYWMYGIRVKDEKTRNGLMTYLEKNGIETRTFFFPMNIQPIYKTTEQFPIAEKLGKAGLYLPSSSHLTDKEKDFVCAKIREFFNQTKSFKDGKSRK